MRYFFLFSVVCVISQIEIAAQTGIYWTNNGYGRIMHSDIGGESSEILAAANNPRFVKFNIHDSLLYWSDAGLNSINSMSVDGEDKMQVVQNLSDPKGFDFDSIGRLFILDGDQIERYSMQGVLENVIHTDLESPLDLAISGNRIYWSEEKNHVFKSSLLDGSDLNVITDEAYAWVDIEIDPQSNIIYYAQDPGSPAIAGVLSRDLVSGQIDTITFGDTPRGITLDIEKRYIYWTERISRVVYRDTMSSVSDRKEIDGSFSSPSKLTLNPVEQKLAVMNFSGGSLVHSINLVGAISKKSLLTSQVYNPQNLVVDTLEEKIYWVNTRASFGDDKSAIIRTELNGENLEVVADYSIVGNIKDLAIDIPAQHIYWTDAGNERIMRMTTAGDSVTVILDVDLDIPSGIDLDLENNKIYWTDFGTDKVQRCNLDGTNVEDVLELGLGTAPVHIQVDGKNEEFYFLENEQSMIFRANFNGEILDTLIHIENVFINLNSFFVDRKKQDIYYSIGRTVHEIRVAKLDGTSDSLLISRDNFSELSDPYGIFVWTDGYTANSQVEYVAQDFRFSPNPFIADFKSIHRCKENVTVELFDLSGKKISQKNFAKGDQIVFDQLSTLFPGLYIIMTEQSDGMRIAHKLIKQ